MALILQDSLLHHSKAAIGVAGPDSESPPNSVGAGSLPGCRQGTEQMGRFRGWGGLEDRKAPDPSSHQSPAVIWKKRQSKGAQASVSQEAPSQRSQGRGRWGGRRPFRGRPLVTDSASAEAWSP